MIFGIFAARYCGGNFDNRQEDEILAESKKMDEKGGAAFDKTGIGSCGREKQNDFGENAGGDCAMDGNV